MECFTTFLIFLFVLYCVNSDRVNSWFSSPPKPPSQDPKPTQTPMPTPPSLISCPACHEKVSSIADFCPHCGRPTEYKMTNDKIRAFMNIEQERRDHYDIFKRISRIFGGK